MITTVLL